MKNIAKGYQDRTFEPKFNPKKNNSDRRPRHRLPSLKEVYIEYKTKSRAGVEYTHFKRTLIT